MVYSKTNAGNCARSLYGKLSICLPIVDKFIHVNEEDENSIVLEGEIDFAFRFIMWFAVVVTEDDYTVVKVVGDDRQEKKFKHGMDVLEYLSEYKRGEGA